MRLEGLVDWNFPQDRANSGGVSCWGVGGSADKDCKGKM